MSVNISSRRSTLFIGGVDYTDQFSLLSGSDSHVEGAGLCSFQGTLTLSHTIGAQLDDWIVNNFETGQLIIIDTEDESRILRRHPRGALRIIKPSFNISSGEQTLKVGDLIALLDYRQPINEDIINIAPTGTTVRVVVNQILELAGVDNVLWRTTIADQYLFRCPIELKTGYLNTVDKILYSFGLLGWIDNQERFVIDQINVAPTTGEFDIDLGFSEAGDVVRLNAKPIPAEVIRVFGTYRKVTEREALIDRIIALELGPIDDLIPGSQGGSGILRQEREIERYLPNNTTNQVQLERLLDLLSYWVYQGYEGLPQIGTSRAQTDLVFYSYENTGSRRLKEIFSQTTKPTTLAISDFVSWAAENNETIFDNLILGQQILAGRRQVVYTYNDAEQLIELRETIWETEADIIGLLNLDWQVVYDAVGIPSDLRQSERTITQWRQENDGWIRIITKSVAKARDNRYRDALPGRFEEDGVDPIDVVRESTSLIIQATGERESSNAGLTTPPATEHLPRQYIDTPCQLEATANFPLFSSEFRPREATLKIPYLPDVIDDPAQAQAVINRFAQIQGALLKGQYKGLRAPMPLLDILFDSYRPLMPFNLQKLDLTRFLLLMDGTTWTMNNTQTLVSTDAIYSAQLVSGLPIPPYRPAIDVISGMVMGAVMESLIEPVVIPMGMVMGGIFIQLAELVLCWDSLTQSQFDRLTATQLDILNISCRKALLVCWDSIDAALFDQLNPGQLDRLANHGCILVFVLCWDTISAAEFDVATPQELDALAQFPCSYL